MAKELKKIFERSSDEIVQGFTVQSWHVSQSVDALTGAEDYDITISGSLTVTGSVYLDGIEDADGSSVYNLVLNQSTGEVFTTASLSGGGGADGTSGTSGAAGTSGTGGAGTSGTSGEGTSGTSGIGQDGSSGTSGDDGSSGTSGATGDPGTSGTSGTGGAGGGGTSGTSGDGANGALIFPYQIHDDFADPPSGTIELNVGNLAISHTDGTGTDISDFFDTINDYGDGSGTGVNAILKVEKVGDPTFFNLYNLKNLSSAGLTYDIFVSSDLLTDNTFSDGDDVLISFNLVGVYGTSGTSGAGGSGTGGDGTSGTSGDDGSSGTSGDDGTSGTSGDDGSSGTSGTTGTSGNGTAGTSGTGGAGTAGTSGTGGAGTSGTSGVNGTSGTSGRDGDNWTSTPTNPVSAGINVGDQHLNTTTGDVFQWTGSVWSSSGNIKGSSGSSGTSGDDGTSGTSGDDGTSGTSGSSGTSGISPGNTPGTQFGGSGGFISRTMPNDTGLAAYGWLTVEKDGVTYYIPAWVPEE